MANQSPLAHQFPEISEYCSGTSAAPLTMISLEIAELTGKNHADVLRDIRKMLNELGVDSKFAGYYTAENGKRNPCFYLPRREVEILVTGYSTALRASVIDRWHELEQEVTTPSLASSDLPALHHLLLGYTERAFMLEQQVKDDAPKVGFYNVMAETTQLFSVSTVAKTLDTGPIRLFTYMREHKILISKHYKFNEPYQVHQEAGRFQVKWGYYKNNVTGEIELKATPYFTGKGVIWIEQFIAKHGRDGL
ncbi:phage antirepressor KilAC domain-containing protein [Pseudomonas sp. GM25]|uniref:phage antirepressor KilAC domain-containing protein n=1 Tax=Pseudomonas sp. GM25 TaxID=1144327 RepID=UPI0002704FD3|nr:phage regulatory protein/antirepressor Ant [Pseudomonas sp. GM25]EJM25762.1 putative phage-encoded protein [Pseudomonas sp. GM25]